MQNKHIAFIGAGNMTRSIISGLVKSGYPSKFITASNPSEGKLIALKRDFDINTTQHNQTALERADIVVLAVKPQLMESMCAGLDINPSTKDTLFISIAAGMPISTLSRFLKGAIRIVRTMPNTPSALGMGMTGLFANENVPDSDKHDAQFIMQSVGEIIWVNDESDINGVIAAAGSSPAYFFAILEAMQTATEELGFSSHDSRKLVQQAMLGAAHMVVENPDLDLATLRQQVTSKGGATAKAIEHMQNHELSNIMRGAMHAAIARAKEMETSLS